MDLSAGMFYAWWLLMNAFYAYAEYTFFSLFTGRKIKVRSLLLYIGITCLFTAVVLATRFPTVPREIIHAALMYFFMSFVFKLNTIDRVTPVVILFSLKTFMDGISAVLMRWMVERITEPLVGNLTQMCLHVVLAYLFFLGLRYIARWHKVPLGQTISSYLYVLLLPCVFIVWVVRFGFGLDQMNLSAGPFPFSDLSPAWMLITVLGAISTFFIILKVFKNIVMLSQQETDRALLNSQLQEQKIHLAEALKRDEQLRSFQHDIDNHLAVLSGLLKERNYTEAEEYFQKLQVSSGSLRRRILTGHSVLDVLLREKFGYAEQNQIAVSCHASLPADLPVDAMDLCIIVSNALDNAIQACLSTKRDQPKIEVTLKVRRQFLLIEVTNPANPAALPEYGTGLRNIRGAVEKYQGAMEIGMDDERFRLSVLLCLEMEAAPPNTERN